MSLIVNTTATFTVTVEDGRSITMNEEEISCAWAFGNGGRGDFGEFMNFLKWLAEMGRRTKNED